MIVGLGRRNGSSSTATTTFTYSGNKRSGWTYDSNGNVTCTNPGAVHPLTVEYNVLNLPALFAEEDGYQTAVCYLADGTKYTATEDSSSDGYRYLGPFRYSVDSGLVLDAAVTGGRAVKVSGNWVMHYFTTDHLGSTRLVTDASGSVLEQFDYLPYGETCNNTGLAVANSHKTEYLYGGKELPQLFGIDWYDSVARWQTTSGVFSSPDPLMEKYFSVSPYAYCAGNPVNRIDPDGTDDKDKIAGAIIGVFTNIIPGTGSLRDVYKPSDASDYNRALQKADAVSAIAGVAMISGGGTMAAAGETISTAGAAAAVTIVGAPEGAVALAGGAATATAGEAIAGLGVMMMANAADNAKDGYDRGKQNTSSDNSNNAPVNKEAGLPEVPIPEGYSKTQHGSQGRAVYKKGHYYITRDNTQHNGGVWKKAKSVKDLQNRERRMGTYDEKLNRIGD